MPEGWNFYTDGETGRTFYHNHQTGEKTWIRPKLPPKVCHTQLHPLPSCLILILAASCIY
jgi:hypothetical protein